jgi:hypothetical protein
MNDKTGDKFFFYKLLAVIGTSSTHSNDQVNMCRKREVYLGLDSVHDVVF